MTATGEPIPSLLDTVAQGLHRLVVATDVPGATRRFLGELGEAVAVDRVYVFEQHADPRSGRALVSQRYEWTAPGVLPQQDNPDLQDFPVEEALPRWFRVTTSGEVIRGFVRDFPSEERAILEPQGILSILVVPILRDRQCWGFVGFDDCNRGRTWNDTETLLLRTAAGALGSAFLRDRAEAALRASEERLRLALEGADLGFWDWDLTTGAVVFSRQWAAMLGYAPAELAPDVSTWERLVHPDDLPRARAVLEAHLAGAQDSYECEHRLRCRNGEWRWILDRGKVVQRDAAGRPLRACGTHLDISERKQAEHLLRVERDLGLALSTSLTAPQVYEQVLQAALRIEGFDCGGCYERDERDGSLRLRCHQGLSAEFVAAVTHLPADSDRARLVTSGRAAFGSWTALGQPGQPALDREGLRALAVVPICHDGRALACLNLASHLHDEVPELARHALESIAAHMGGALARTRVEAALVESQGNLQALFDQLDDFLFILDEQGRILHANPVVSARLEYTPEELLSMDILQLHPEETWSRAATVVEGMLDGSETVCILPLRSRTGEFIPVETRVTRGSWSGRPVLFGLSRDVTERKRVEAALRESEGRNRAILHAIPDILFRIDRQGRFLDVVAKQPSDLLVSADQIRGRRVADLLPGDIAGQIQAALERALGAGGMQVLEYQLPMPGGLQDYEARFVALQADEVLALVRNITERKRAADQLMRTIAAERELSGLKSSFVSMVSHEFRTPLSAILGAAEMLEDFQDRLSPEKRADYFQMIRREIRRMTGMLEEVLLQGRLDAGRVAFAPRPVDLGEVCHRIVAGVQAAFPKHPPVEFTGLPPAGWVLADENLLRSMLSNLLTNGFKYSPRRTPVRLHLQREGEHLVFEVRDQGIGIPADDVGAIGSAFRRGRNVGYIKGSGVGLYVVKKCAELHGGALEVESEVDVGSTFRLRIHSPPSPVAGTQLT
jgi:PAS domain S-box-containing protein